MENIELTNENLTPDNLTPERPVFLKVLCILTFVSTGIGALSSLLTPLFADKIIELIQSSPNYDEANMADAMMVLNAGWGYYLLMFVLSVASLIGAVLMWKIKKIGFHVYALANSIALFVPILMFSMPISWSGILLTACFIVLYALNLKHMK